MKLTIRIPGEMYSFDEVELEVPATKDAPMILKEWADDVRAAFAPKPINEMPAKDFDVFVENMLMGVPNHTETLEKLSPAQKTCHNTIKRALNRIKAKGLTTLEDNE